jgi:hypothetical protein
MNATKSGKQSIQRLLDQARSDLGPCAVLGRADDHHLLRGAYPRIRAGSSSAEQAEEKDARRAGEVTQPGRVNELPSMKKARVA